MKIKNILILFFFIIPFLCLYLISCDIDSGLIDFMNDSGSSGGGGNTTQPMFVEDFENTDLSNDWNQDLSWPAYYSSQRTAGMPLPLDGVMPKTGKCLHLYKGSSPGTDAYLLKSLNYLNPNSIKFFIRRSNLTGSPGSYYCNIIFYNQYGFGAGNEAITFSISTTDFNIYVDNLNTFHFVDPDRWYKIIFYNIDGMSKEYDLKIEYLDPSGDINTKTLFTDKRFEDPSSDSISAIQIYSDAGDTECWIDDIIMF